MVALVARTGSHRDRQLKIREREQQNCRRKSDGAEHRRPTPTHHDHHSLSGLPPRHHFQNATLTTASGSGQLFLTFGPLNFNLI